MRRTIRESGFTLLEVLIAMGVFAIGSLGVLAMVVTGMDLNANARQMQEASLLAQWKLEQLQMMPMSDDDITACGTACWASDASAVASTTRALVQPADLIGGTSGSNFNYELKWVVKNGTGPSAGLRYFGVIVFWPRDESLLGGDWRATVDCVAEPQRCRRVQFHSYRRG